MFENPWQQMTLENARAYDERKESGPSRNRIAVKRALIWRTLRPYLTEDKSQPILDLGGGTGVWAVPLAQEEYQVVLADISEGFLARAKEKAEAAGVAERITFVHADLDDLSRFGDGKFPLILAIGDPLSYCQDAVRALREIHRIAARKPYSLAMSRIDTAASTTGVPKTLMRRCV